MTDIIIIGAGTAGMSAAIYAARAGKKVLVLEGESFGGQIVYAPRVENYPGIRQISGAEFASGLTEQVLSLGVEMEMETVLSIRRLEEEAGHPKGFAVRTEEGEHCCKSLILAAGVRHRHLGLDREEKLLGAGVSYCAVCDGAFYQDQDVAVAGGGNTALQDALFLSSYCRSVTVIHRRDTFRGEQRLVEQLSQKPNVTFCLDSVVETLEGEDALSALVLRGRDGSSRRLEVTGLFVAVGQVPCNQPFADVVALDQNGFIAAGESCVTSAPGVFAAGDCRTKSVRQLSTAAADGAVAGLAACEYCESL